MIEEVGATSGAMRFLPIELHMWLIRRMVRYSTGVTFTQDENI